LINRIRKKGDSKATWSPGSKSRACSDQFSEEGTFPTLKLGYNADSRLRELELLPPKRRKLQYKESAVEEDLSLPPPVPKLPYSSLLLRVEKLEAEKKQLTLYLQECKLNLALKNQRIKALRSVVTKQTIELKRVFDRLIVINKDALFYTGLQNIDALEQLHVFVKPYMQKKWHGNLKTQPLKNRRTKMGRKTSKKNCS